MDIATAPIGMYEDENTAILPTAIHNAIP
jgi:hypothetical protein